MANISQFKVNDNLIDFINKNKGKTFKRIGFQGIENTLIIINGNDYIIGKTDTLSFDNFEEIKSIEVRRGKLSFIDYIY